MDSILETNEEDMMTTFQTNVVGAMHTVQTFREFVCNSALRLFVVISSDMGSITECTGENAASYRISKAALNMLCMLVAKESRITECGARVLVLHPGWVDTDMGRVGDRKPPVSVEESTEGIMNIVERAITVQHSNAGMKSSSDEKFHGSEENVESNISSSNCVFLQYNGEMMPW